MQTVFGLEALKPGWPEATVCIGVFDGVHLGHQAVIRKACEDAAENSRPAIVLTFDRNPLSVLRPDSCPMTVLAPSLKMAKISAVGADLTAIATFDHAFSQQSADEFLQNILRARFNTAKIVVGHDFACGKGREGTAEWLSQHIPTEVLQPLEMDGRRVSSTEIRGDIAAGKMREAARLLGRSFALAGLVVRGNMLGRKLGMPTANIVPVVDQALPMNGIYAGFAFLNSGRHAAAISVGDRPAVPGAGYAIEAHILDFQGGDLYGRELTLSFVTRLRDELWFESQEQLVEQMRRDVVETREALGV